MSSNSTRSGSRTHDADLLRRTTDLALDYFGSLDERRVAPKAGRERLLSSLGGALPERGLDAEIVIEDLAAAVDSGLVASAGPRYFGFVIGGSLPAAVAADWLTTAWDQNAGLFACSPAASVVEEVAGSWLIDLLGLPAETSFGLTTGCQMAHFTCLATARHAVLERASWDVEERGLFGAPEIDVIVGAEAHATIYGALQYLGLGRARVIVVDTDGQGRMRMDELARLLPEGERPLIVCLQAGNVNTGSFDPMDEAIGLIRLRHPGAWVHVDGAFGIWAAASPRFRSLAAGYELADSWATDGHKWLNVPYDCGYAFVADPKAHAAALAPQKAAYIVEAAAERDEFHWVPEFSRRARGFPTYAAIRSLGRHGVADLVDRCCALAGRMADGLRAAGEGIEVLNDVVLDQILVRFTAPGNGDADARTREVIRRVQEDGTCWLSGTTWHGKAAMRISIVNWATGENDVDRSLEAILQAAREA
jgi:glutamate/tyrosine decarboxylase-like PLP-dependent enzyme